MSTEQVSAMVRGRRFSDTSWNGVVSRIVAAYQLDTTVTERTEAARSLEDGERVRLGHYVDVNPVRS